MRKVILMTVTLLMVLASFSFGEVAATFPEVLKATQLVVGDDQIYVIEDTTIYIYSLNDYKFKKKFGKAGEGPQEFQGFVVVTPHEDQLLINSIAKISYYTKDGIFKKEQRTSAGIGSNLFYPLKEGFIGSGGSIDKNIHYVTINFYDSKLNKGKELFRMKAAGQQSGKIELLKRTFAYQTHDNKIYIIGEEGFLIDVMDHTGKKLFSIKQKEYKRRKFTSEDEKIIRNFIKKQFRQRYEFVKDRLAFPDYFPEILDFFIADNKIYVSTWKWENKRVEFFIFDLKGKLEKNIYIPFAFQDALRAYPVSIKNGKLYQLIENDEEEWELHISGIE